MQGRTLVVLTVVFGLVMVTAAAQGKDMPIDFTHCYSGKTTVLSASKALTVLSFELMGILRSNHERKTLDNNTSHCIGLVQIAPGERIVSGYCKYMSPDKDFLTTKFSNIPGTNDGTWKALQGTGKWQGVTGNAAYKRLTKGKRIKKGTFANCSRATGTLTLPD